MTNKNTTPLRKKLFSLPFNSLLTKREVQERYLPFVKRYREFLYDIYFSISLPPFVNDAMGQGEINASRNRDIVRFLLSVQEHSGVEISATFNNVSVSPDWKNMELFIGNFRRYYEMGIRSVTLPHMHWMLSGEIKRAFPKLKVKNTVLRKVNTPQQYADHCEAGFDVVNIDRVNIRDRDNLKRLKRAYDKYKKPMVILVNEGCRGQCPAMDEHYAVNCAAGAPYFKHDISRFTCPLWSSQDQAYHLKIADMPPWREDFEEILEYVQILKLHGRSEKNLLFYSMRIVQNYAEGKEHLTNPDFFLQRDYDKEKLAKWRKHTKNCKFECWNCNVCEELAASARELVF